MRRRFGWLIACLALAGLIIVVVLTDHGPTRRYRVPSASMLPTVAVGQNIEIETAAYRTARPARGDIVVFHPPLGAEDGRCGAPGEGPGPAAEGHAGARSCARPTLGLSNARFIKRVVGLPGDHVAIRGGRALIDGRPLAEPYVRECGDGPGCDLGAITIPRGLYFMLGDNRGESDDSRYWGPVPLSSIEGRFEP